MSIGTQTLAGLAACGALIFGALATRAATDGTEWPKPVVAGGIEYGPDYEPGSKGHLGVFIRAKDLKSGELGRIKLYEGKSHGGWMRRDRPDDPRIASLARFGEGLIAVTDDRTAYYIDPAAKSAEVILDRRLDAVECEVHQAPMSDFLIPIHYGITSRPARGGPNARMTYPGGCCVGEEKKAAIRVCEKCRRD